MDVFFSVDWKAAFAPTVGIAEIMMRASLVYLGIFALLRIVLRREVGTVGMTDLLMMVLIADASSNAMTSQYQSVPEGLTLVGTLVFWNYALDRLGYRFPRFERFLHPSPLPLIKSGRLLRRNMRREMITEDELMSRLREQGIEDVAHVKMMCMEGDGRLSVIEREGKSAGKGDTDERKPM